MPLTGKKTNNDNTTYGVSILRGSSTKGETSNNTSNSSTGSSTGGVYGTYSGSGSTNSKTKQIDTNTTKTTTKADKNNQAALKATAAYDLQNLIKAARNAETNYQSKLKANQDLYDAQTRQNLSTNNATWYKQQQKMQNAAANTANKLGNGMYGSSGVNTKNLIALGDDINDQDVLSNLQTQQNAINQDLYSNNTEAATTYNSTLQDNQAAIGNALSTFLTNYQNTLGSKAKNTTKNVTTNSTSNKSDDDSSESITKNNTNSTVTNAVTTNQNPYLANLKTKKGKNKTSASGAVLDSSNIRWNKLISDLGLSKYMTGSQAKKGTYGLGKATKTAQPLQYQDSYRSAADTTAALSRRYG